MRSHLAEARGEYVLSMAAGDVGGMAASRGLDADGYFWEGVVRQLVALHDPGLATRFTYDSDLGSFAAESQDREVLATVQELLEAAIDDPAQLQRVLSISVDAEFMD